MGGSNESIGRGELRICYARLAPRRLVDAGSNKVAKEEYHVLGQLHLETGLSCPALRSATLSLT